MCVYVYIYNDVLSENGFVRGLVVKERNKGAVRVRFILSIRPCPSKGSFYFYFFIFFLPRFFLFFFHPLPGFPPTPPRPGGVHRSSAGPGERDADK